MHFSFSKLFFVVTCVSFFTFPAHASTVAGLTMFAPGLDQGLTAHWTFDAEDMRTNIRDRMGVYSGVLFLGTTGNTATTTEAGPMGQALVFDGVNDAVSAPIIETVETYPFTYSVWFKRNGASIAYFIDQQNNGAHISISALGVVTYVVNGGSGSVTLTSPAGLHDGQWHHIVGVSRASNDHELYIDAVSVDTDTTSVTNINSNYVLYFGRGYTGANYFDGALDDVRVYSRGLSLNDIQRLYILGKGMRMGVATLVVGGATTKIGATPVAPAGSSLATGLVGHWTFDGKHMYQNVADISGQANHGRLIDQTPTTTAPGVLGQGLLLDGVDDYVNLGDIDMTTTMSASAWFYVDSLDNGASNGNKGIVGRYYNGSRSWMLFIDEQTSSSNPRAGVALSSSGALQSTNIVLGTTMIQTGRWYHVAFTYDASTGTTLYLNGVVEGTDETPPASLFVSALSATIGAQYSLSESRYFLEGKVDDVRIYNRPLSGEDIQQLYHTGQPQSFGSRQINSAPTPSDAGKSPSNAANLGGGAQSVTLYMSPWTDPDGDSVTGYYFERFAGSFDCQGVSTENSGWIADPTIAGGFSINIDDAQQNSWKVKARDSNGKESAWSSCFYFDNSGGGSCPYVFGWDGERYQFEVDIFGSGGLGYKKWSMDDFVQPTPNRTYVLKNAEPRNGAFEWRIVGDLAEVDYFDYFRMYSYHIPENTDIIVESPTLGSGAHAKSILHTVSTKPLLPENATRLDTRENVTEDVRVRDNKKVIINKNKKETYEYETIEVDFGDISQYPTKKLIIGGSTTYPVTGEGIARKQQFGLEWGLYVQDAQGEWKKVPNSLYSPTKPLSFDSLIAVDISKIFISQNTKIRLEYLYKVYIDYVALDVTEDMSLVVAEEHPIVDADLHDFNGWHEFDKDGYVPDYYDTVALEDEYVDFPGYYTRFGKVDELLTDKDDKFVIMAKADEVTVKNALPKIEPTNGYKRVYMLDVSGYYKALGKTQTEMAVEPMPFSGMSAFPYPETEHYPNTPEYQEYLFEWNTRYLSPEKERNSNSLMNNVWELLSGVVVE